METKHQILEHVVSNSSQVKAIKYNTDTKELDVQFVNTGKWYRYYDVLLSTYEAFKAAPSAGIFLNTQIKGKYSYKAL
jgi:hypothetical protein